MWALNVIWTRRYCMAETAVCLAVWQFLALFVAGLAGLALVPWLGPLLESVPGTGFATLAWQPVGWATAGAVFLIGLAGITATGCQARGYLSGASSIMGLFDFSFLLWAPFFAWLANAISSASLPGPPAPHRPASDERGIRSNR